MNSELEALRAEIDDIDAKIVALLASRFRVTSSVGQLKAEQALPAVDPAREAAQEARFRELATVSGLKPELVAGIFRRIIDEVVQNHGAQSSSSLSPTANAEPFVWSDSLDDLDWNELTALYHAAPLGNKNPQSLKTAFGNSMFRCFVYEGGKLVGVGRALADGVDCAYLCDVALLPSHQGQGLGKQIVVRLLNLLVGYKKIILYCVPGKEPFYKKLGFQRMTTAMAIFENQALALQRGYLDEA